MSEPEVDSAEITALLRAVEGGDKVAIGTLFERVYGELQRIARRQLRAAPPLQTLHTTELVHEAYVRLSGAAHWSTRDRFHFFALTAQAMRRVLIDHARKRTRQKRGGRGIPLSLEEVDVPVAERADELLALDGAQQGGNLRGIDPGLGHRCGILGPIRLHLYFTSTSTRRRPDYRSSPAARVFSRDGRPREVSLRRPEAPTLSVPLVLSGNPSGLPGSEMEGGTSCCSRRS